jgi:hypothetical protein
VARGESFCADLPRHAEKRLKFHVIVAVCARDGSASAKIVVHKGADDAIFKLMFEVDDVVGKIEMLRDALGVIDIIKRAAAVLHRAISLELRQAALIPELHGQADDGTALLLQDGRNGRRVNAAGHGDSDQAGLSFPVRGEGIELDLSRHNSSTLLVYFEIGENPTL